jgi:hypothetical protein
MNKLRIAAGVEASGQTSEICGLARGLNTLTGARQFRGARAPRKREPVTIKCGIL